MACFAAYDSSPLLSRETRASGFKSTGASSSAVKAGCSLIFTSEFVIIMSLMVLYDDSALARLRVWYLEYVAWSRAPKR